MMIEKFRIGSTAVGLSVLLLLLMAGCASPAVEPTPTAEPVAMADTATPEPPAPTTTPSPIPTHTPAADSGDQPFPAASYTHTPSPTSTLTATATPTATPSFTSTPTPTNTPTLTPTPHYVTRNADWTPVEREINGTLMVLVPAGCFEMGENGEGGEQCFDEPYWIGKTEVTNAEHVEFIAAGGYDNPDYWTEVGWAWRRRSGVDQPSFWADSRFNKLNQPMVGVSWYEAFAHSSWRGATLCTEAQWEYAARGPDGLLYPWGNEFVADYLVYRGNADGRPASVGSRSAGASWVGALDMGGNVWEWTLSEAQEYPYLASDERENISSAARRVLRGGSWAYADTFARTFHRFYGSPVNRGNFAGLRLCRNMTMSLPELLEPNEVYAESDVTGTEQVLRAEVITLQTVNLRAGPSTRDGIVGTAQPGDIYIVLNQLVRDSPSGTWYQLQVGSAEGWIRGDLVRTFTQLSDEVP